MNSLWEKIKESASIQSGLIVGFCLIIYWLGPISIWETNDDAYYNLLFSGQLVTNAPTPYAISVNFVLSSFFTQLYTIAPNIPWYGYFHVTALLLSIWFLNYCYALTHDNDKLLVRLVLSLASVLPFLFFLQFTKTAAVLAVAGYLGLYLLSQVKSSLLRQNLLLHACALSLLVFSFALRSESFFLVTFLCGLLLVKALLQREKALFVTLAMAVFLIMVVALVHKLNYGDEWQNFYTLSRATGPIIDFNQYRYETNQKIYTDAGLSRNDYYFLKSWGFVDSHVYSLERFDHILANASTVAPPRDPLAALQRAASFPAQNFILTAVGLVILLLFVYRHQYRFFSLYVFLPFLICAGILAWQGRFPTRVSTSMVFFFPWAVLVLSGEIRKRLLVGVASIVALVVLAVPVYGQYRDISAIVDFRLVQNQDLHRLGAALSSPPIIIVVLGASFAYEGLLPFESPSYLAGARFVGLGGNNQSPVQKKQLKDNKIDDLFASFVEGKTSYIAIHAGSIGIMKQYFYEHYQKNVNFTPAFSSRSFTVYRLIVPPL